MPRSATPRAAAAFTLALGLATASGALLAACGDGDAKEEPSVGFQPLPEINAVYTGTARSDVRGTTATVGGAVGTGWRGWPTPSRPATPPRPYST